MLVMHGQVSTRLTISCSKHSYLIDKSGSRIHQVSSPEIQHHDRQLSKKSKIKNPCSPERTPVMWGVVKSFEDDTAGRQKVIEYLQEEGIYAESIADDLPSDVEIMSDRIEFLRTVGFETEDMLSHPQILCYSVERNMVPVIDYLERIGLSPRALPQILRKVPMILHSSVEVDLHPIITYLVGYGIEWGDVASVLENFPDVLLFKLEGTISTSVAYLVGIGVHPMKIGKMLTVFPQILGMPVGSNIKRKVDFYSSLGLSPKQIAKMLERRPYVLGLELEETLMPKIDFFMKAGTLKHKIPWLLFRYPDLFSLNVEQKFVEKVEWLTKKLGVLPNDVSSLIGKMPLVLVINKEKAMKRVAFLSNAGFSSEDITKMISEYPQVLAMRLPEAKLNMMHFSRHMASRSIKEITEHPQYLVYSLRDRIIPRFRRINEKGIVCSLGWVLGCSDDKFRRRMSAEYIQPPPIAAFTSVEDKYSLKDEDEVDDKDKGGELIKLKATLDFPVNHHSMYK